MSWPARVLALLLSWAVAVAFGWGAATRTHKAQQAAQALQDSEAARETERLAARSITRISDGLTQDRLNSQRAGAGTAGRLQQLASSTPTPAGCPARNDDPRPAAGLLHDDVRGDLVALAQEADAVADRLRACQATVTVSLRMQSEP